MQGGTSTGIGAGGGLPVNQVVQGDCLEWLARLPGGSVHCVVTSVKKPNDGRFVKGHIPARYSQPQPYWNRDWLCREYIEKQRSAADIANEFGKTENNILYFLAKFGIARRSMREVRKMKRWGCKGPANPMYGRFGKLSPTWNGGHSPERQCVYARVVWKELAKSILKRDGYKCVLCGETKRPGIRLVVHHKLPWARHPKLRFEPTNLETLCELCHKKIHSRS